MYGSILAIMLCVSIISQDMSRRSSFPFFFLLYSGAFGFLLMRFTAAARDV